jgi:Uma2 family endonuclease
MRAITAGRGQIMTVATYKWMIDRYHQAIEAGVFADQSLELLGGELVLMPPEREPHVYFSDRAANILRQALGGQAQIREGRPITIPNDSEPQPDVAIVQPLDAVYLEHHPYPENIFWLMEYSSITVYNNLNNKQVLYAQAGILEYWVVNLQDLQLTVFREPSPSGYRSSSNYKNGTITSLAFPDISIDVQQLFQL